VCLKFWSKNLGLNQKNIYHLKHIYDQMGTNRSLAPTLWRRRADFFICPLENICTCNLKKKEATDINATVFLGYEIYGSAYFLKNGRFLSYTNI
jgi:hypothetical protein